jgi:hypothetical protein
VGVKRSPVVLISSFEHDRTQVWPGDGAMHHSLVSRMPFQRKQSSPEQGVRTGPLLTPGTSRRRLTWCRRTVLRHGRRCVVCTVSSPEMTLIFESINTPFRAYAPLCLRKKRVRPRLALLYPHLRDLSQVVAQGTITTSLAYARVSLRSSYWTFRRHPTGLEHNRRVHNEFASWTHSFSCRRISFGT